MSDLNPKQVRKEVRKAVQEELTAALTKELLAQVQVVVDSRLSAIDKHIKSVLDGIDQRSKDLQSYILRTTSVPTTPNKKDE